ncbi:hypothetical protein GGI07_001366 [Coemansia sp. Benny D115]|nr:hypothetical protein GGI07_001366 [Coemansia sp. Benny D115]
MSEEGETDFDAGQIVEKTPTGLRGSADSAGDQEASARAERGSSSRERRGTGDYDGGYSDRRVENESLSGRRYWRSRSRTRSRSRDHSRRSGYGGAYSENTSAGRRSGDYYEDASDYRGSSSYRQGRYGELGGRTGYSRRYERAPRYRRRESGRSMYSRSGAGYPGGRDDLSDEDGARRDIDKERAIEELRSRVRATTDRTVSGASGIGPAGRERSRSPINAALSSRTATTKSMAAAGTSAPESLAKPAGSTEAQAIVKFEEAAAAEGSTIDIDDIEEGEHIETEVKKPAVSQHSDYSRERQDSVNRARGYSRERRERDRSTTPSRSHSRSYHGAGSHDPDSRRSGSYRDYPSGGDQLYRRKHDSYSDRRDYRPHENYESRSAYSRYAEGGSGYQPSRYPGARSPEPHDSAAYRSERRHYSSRYDRHYGAGEGGRSGYARQPQSPPSRHRSHSRSRSPSRSSPHNPRSIPAAEDTRRSRHQSYSDRYYEHHPSRPSSRSPHGPSTRGAETADPSTYNAEASSNQPPPPPPPPPMPHVNTTSTLASPLTTGGPYSGGESPYHGYSSARAYRRSSRTPKIGSHGGNHPPRSSGYPLSSTSRYYEHEGGTNVNDTGIPGGSVAAGIDYQRSRGQTPDSTAIASHADAAVPVHGYGTDLFISRLPDSEKWLEARMQVREQEKRIREHAAVVRRSGFELSYSGWGVLKAESQVQLAGWQLERAEQGLGAADRSLMDSMELGDM